MYSKIVKYIQNGRKINYNDLKIPNFDQSYWDDQFNNIILVDKFRLKIGDKFIPTVEQADDCLGKFHGRKLTSLHVYQEKVLVECLERENYAFPAFAGGLSRAVRE